MGRRFEPPVGVEHQRREEEATLSLVLKPTKVGGGAVACHALEQVGTCQGVGEHDPLAVLIELALGHERGAADGGDSGRGVAAERLDHRLDLLPGGRRLLGGEWCGLLLAEGQKRSQKENHESFQDATSMYNYTPYCVYCQVCLSGQSRLEFILMKSFLKGILVSILGSQVRRLRAKHDFKIVGVVGSIGKTSTKLAIAKALSAEKRVRYQEGNYNDILSVPLCIFGKEMPSLLNPFSWAKIILQNEAQISSDFPFDFLVLELGTDKPGDIAEFRKYLHIDIAVLTAVTPEHMEFFGTLENVIQEEWSVSFFSDVIFVNRDLCETIPENVDHKKIIFYGKDFGSVYKIQNIQKEEGGFNFEISYKGGRMTDMFYSGVSEVQLYSICVSLAIIRHTLLSIEAAKDSLSGLQSFSGRMQRLEGLKNSIIIDDSYNASPASMKIALDTLYTHKKPHKVAVLGMMNELGSSSPSEHTEVGKYCDPKSLDFVITIGKDANRFLADAAEARGVNVYRAKNSKEAGEILLKNLKEDSAVLVKGSQNGVFAEEAIKAILLNQEDEKKLVRQDEEWKLKKNPH